MQDHRTAPSLNHAFARVNRATDHLSELKKNLVPLEALGNESESSNTILLLSMPMPEPGLIPPLVSILVGEIVYNLRAALDYLIYELAFLDSGVRQEKTQFPICEWPKSWGTKHTQEDMLRGLSDTHKGDIKLLQPFSSCEWTGKLQALSNPDKHKTLRDPQMSHTVALDRDTGRFVFWCQHRIEAPNVVRHSVGGW